MSYFKYIFCVLVYRNIDDLEELILSIIQTVEDFQIVIVNSYYNETSRQGVEKIAWKYNCNFINVENKGYGFGNNLGIDYILRNYECNYIIVSNPDILIEKFNEFKMPKEGCFVMAPFIKTASLKSQNPYWFVENLVSEWLVYLGFKYNLSLIAYIGFFINKIIREVGLIFFKISNKQIIEIFAAHGSFFLITQEAAKILSPLFDDKMFLFAEEAYLAHKLKSKKIKTYMTKSISVLHKEDGSLKLSDFNENREMRKSILYYFEQSRGKLK